MSVCFISPVRRTKNKVCLAVALNVVSERMNRHLPNHPQLPSPHIEPKILTNSYRTPSPHIPGHYAPDSLIFFKLPKFISTLELFVYPLPEHSCPHVPASFSSLRSQSNVTSSERPCLPRSTHPVSSHSAPFSSQYLTLAELSCCWFTYKLFPPY